MAGSSLTRVAPAATVGTGALSRAERAELLLRETNHRCANDLQLVASLLALQSRRAESPEARAALADATARVSVLARSRAGLSRQDKPDLATAVRDVCEALHSQSELLGIRVSTEIEQELPDLSSDQVATLALAVNELATNAIKHAFGEDQGGRITIILRQADSGAVIVIVDDDGLPLPDGALTDGHGMGFGLVRRLIASAGGTFDPPGPGSKCFTVEMCGQPA